MSDVPEIGRGRTSRGTECRRPVAAPRRGQSAHPLGDHGRRIARRHPRLGTLPRPLRERLAQGAAAAAEGRHADAADGGAALGGRPRLQPRLPRPPGPRARARHPARGDRPRRGGPAVADGHLPAAVDGDARRGPRRRPRRDDAAPEPRGHRRRRRRRDVRQHLRPGARPAAGQGGAAAHPAGPVAQRPDARGLQQAARLDRRRHPRRARGSGVAFGRVVRDPVSRRRRRRRLRQVRRPGDGAGGRAVAAAAPAQPDLAHRGDRHQVQRPAQGVEGGGRLDQRRLPGRAVRGAAALPRRQGHPHRDAADGGPGQPALGRRSRGRQSVRRDQPRRAGRRRRPGRRASRRCARR